MNKNLSINDQYRIALYGKNAGIKINERVICSIHKRAQIAINILKQEKVIELSNEIFKQFHCSPLAKTFCEDKTTYRGFFCNMSLKDLGITKEEIITRLVKEKIIIIK